jgi:hypothetical protein
MGKNKNKDEIPNPNSVTNRDILQRLNFLYQASVLLNGIAPIAPSLPPDDANHDGQPSPQPEIAEESASLSGKGPRRRRVVTTSELSRSYVDTMKSVGQKTNVKMYAPPGPDALSPLIVLGQRSFSETLHMQRLQLGPRPWGVCYCPDQKWVSSPGD